MQVEFGVLRPVMPRSSPAIHGRPDPSQGDFSGEQASGLYILPGSNLECRISFGKFNVFICFI